MPFSVSALRLRTRRGAVGPSSAPTAAHHLPALVFTDLPTEAEAQDEAQDLPATPLRNPRPRRCWDERDDSSATQRSRVDENGTRVWNWDWEWDKERRDDGDCQQSPKGRHERMGKGRPVSLPPLPMRELLAQRERESRLRHSFNPALLDSQRSEASVKDILRAKLEASLQRAKEEMDE